MAHIKRGILGGGSGKIGNVVMSAWKGIAVLKSLPLSVANPRTVKQVAQRSKMKAITLFATFITVTVIKPLWDRFAMEMSGFNAFVKHNIEPKASSVALTYTNIKIALGKLYCPAITSSGISVADGVLDMSFPSAVVGDYGADTDVPYAVAFNVTRLTGSGGFQDGNTRADGEVQVPMPLGTQVGDTVHSYLAFRSADGTMVSNGVYKICTVTA